MALEQDERISAVFAREESKLRGFIRNRVPDPRDAEDILQDVFAELVEANRLLMPIEYVTGWLFRVATNRIIDLFRRRKSERIVGTLRTGDDDATLDLQEILPSPEMGPDAVYVRKLMLDELERAVRELPEAQRDVFIAHEIEGKSFNEIAAETGVKLNTLLSRKRYAVLHLRERLRMLYEEFMET